MIPLKKLDQTLEPVTMASYFNKAEKKLSIKNTRSPELVMDCYCFKDVMSKMGIMLCVTWSVMGIGICVSIIKFIQAKRPLNTVFRIQSVRNTTDCTNV